MKAIFRILALSAFVFSITENFSVGETECFGKTALNSPDGSVVTNPVQTLRADTCEGQWQLMKAKLPDSKVTMKFTTTKEGQAILKWSGRKERLANVEIHKAKGPVNADGEIEMCTVGASMVISDDSYSIKELKQDERLSSGYYAVRVIFHSGNGPNESSDWIVVRIK